MRKAKKAVRKAAEAREKAKAKKIARTKSTNDDGWNLNESGILVPNTPPVPPRLFKYAPPNRTRICAMLVDELVYFASPLAFNDPYDSRVFPAGSVEEMQSNFKRSNNAEKDAQWPRSLEDRKKMQSKHLDNYPESANQMADSIARAGNVGICCLSAKCDSLPMWAHYANDHKGVCFVFNLSNYEEMPNPNIKQGCFPFSIVQKIEYRTKILGREEALNGQPYQHFFCKSEEWAYEQEWRALMMDAHYCIPKTGERLVDRDRSLQEYRGIGSYRHNGTLFGVVLGCRMHDPLKQEIKKIAASRNLAVWRAETQVGQFGLDFHPCNEKAKAKNSILKQAK